MQHLPEWLQPFVIWVSGKPITGQTPHHQTPHPKRPFRYLFKLLATLGISVSLGIIAIQLQGCGFLLLIGSWMVTASAACELQAVVVHHCAHKNFSRDRKADKWIGRIVSAAMLFQDFDTYERSHAQHHRNPCDPNDETVKFLRNLAGIEPGKSRTELWQRLWLSLVSPKFHAQFLVTRLVSSLWAASSIHCILSWSYLLSVLAFIEINNMWQAFWIVWVFPVIILYQASTLLRLCYEHLWVPLEVNAQRNKRDYSQATVGIFLGDPIPDLSQSAATNFQQWCLWWGRLLFIHLPIRLFVLIGDTGCHDYHHRHPGTDDWANAAFARQQDIDAGCPGWSKPYREVFGLFAAIDLAFRSLSEEA